MYNYTVLFSVCKTKTRAKFKKSMPTPGFERTYFNSEIVWYLSVTQQEQTFCVLYSKTLIRTCCVLYSKH